MNDYQNKPHAIAPIDPKGLLCIGGEGIDCGNGTNVGEQKGDLLLNERALSRSIKALDSPLR